MIGFEPRFAGVISNGSLNCATITAHLIMFVQVGS